MIDLQAELATLLDAWRVHRTTELAAAIDELSSYFALVLPPITGKTRAERQRSWLARGRRPSIVDVPMLLATVPHGGTIAQTTEQLEQIAAWPADPRTTHLARRLLSVPPFETWSGNQKVRNRLLEVIEHHADPRVLPALASGRMHRVFDSSKRVRMWVETVATHVERHDPTRPGLGGMPRSIPASTAQVSAALVARIERELATGRALRDAVRLEQDDDEQPSRTVLLDWLLERGYVPPA